MFSCTLTSFPVSVFSHQVAHNFLDMHSGLLLASELRKDLAGMSSVWRTDLGDFLEATEVFKVHLKEDNYTGS